MIRKPITPEAALIRAEDLCARSERSTNEIHQKLIQWGIAADDRDKIIRTLTEKRFINDERFCQAYVRDKLSFSHWGRLKIAQGLYRHGIAREIVSDALESIDAEQYNDILRHILEVKARNIPDSDSYQTRMKLLRFAVSRGFEPGLILNILNNH